MLTNLKTFFIALVLFITSINNSVATESSYPNHPFLLLNQSEIDTLRKQISVVGWKADLYKNPNRDFTMLPTGNGIRSNAELWLKRDISIPARSGHYHDFFCEDGTRLEIPAGQSFASGPYRCPACGRTYSGEKYEAACRRFIHADLDVAALDLALVSVLENKPEYAAKSAEILLKYAVAYPGPHTNITTGGMIYQSLDESMWVIPLAQSYDLIYNTLDNEQRSKIEKFLRTVASGIQKCGAGGNWGSWHLSAVGSIGYAIGDKDFVEWATTNFKKQIKNDLGDDGLWPESVQTYHFFPLQAFLFFAETSIRAGVPLYNWEPKPAKSLLKMFTAPLDYMYPNFRLPAINDGWFESFIPADLYELAAYRDKNPQFQSVLANGYNTSLSKTTESGIKSNFTKREGLYAFLFGKNVDNQPAVLQSKSINFPVLGYYMSKSNNGNMMSFDYGKFMGHGQFEKMGITLFANNKLWMADYGTPGYGSTILEWYKSTFAHNVVVVDGKQQAKTKENSIEICSSTPEYEMVRSKTTQAYAGVEYQRTIIRKNNYFVVIDDLKSDSAHVYDFYLHSEGKLQLQGKLGDSTSYLLPGKWLNKAAMRLAQKQINGQWSEKSEGIAIWMSGSTPLTALTTKCPAETGNRKIDLLIVRQRGFTSRFVTVLYPVKANEKLNVTLKNGTLNVKSGNRNDKITLP